MDLSGLRQKRGGRRSAFELGLARGGDLSACFIDRQNNRGVP